MPGPEPKLMTGGSNMDRIDISDLITDHDGEGAVDVAALLEGAMPAVLSELVGAAGSVTGLRVEALGGGDGVPAPAELVDTVSGGLAQAGLITIIFDDAGSSPTTAI